MDIVLLGKRIRDQRNKLGLTQEALAELAEVSTAYMGRLERGERNMTVKTIVKIANALGVSVDSLLHNMADVHDDTYVNEWLQLIANKDEKEIAMALDVIKTMFSHTT